MLASMERWKHETQQLADGARSLKGVRLETLRVAAIEVAAGELLHRRLPACGSECRG